MAGPHENLEHAEHAEHASHSGNKKIALLISVLALFLAFSETLGKSAQTAAITHNVASNDLWAFYQAKHIRGTALRIAAEQLQLTGDSAAAPEVKAKNCEDCRGLAQDRRPLRRRSAKRRRPQAARRKSQAIGRKA